MRDDVLSPGAQLSRIFQPSGRASKGHPLNSRKPAMTSSTAPAPDPSTSARRMQVGIAGLGAGAAQVIRAMAHAPYIQLKAAGDT